MTRKRSKPIKRTATLSRKTSLPPRARYIKRKPNTAYQKVRKEFMLKSDGNCKARIVGICMGASVDIQHIKGRGVHLLDKETYIDLCRACGEYINTHAAYALQHGWAESRL